jgi:hypothetical protein
MTVLDEHGRPRPPLTGDETATLLGFLDLQRGSVGWSARAWTPPACGRPSAFRR